MIEITEALQALATQLREPLERAGFSLYYPDGADRRALPIVQERDTQFISFAGEGGTLRIEFSGSTIGLYHAEAAPDAALRGDMTRLSLSLFEPQEADVRDVKYVADEFAETIDAKFAPAKKQQSGKKLPNAVSKTAVRNGAFYDLASFGSRFTAIYPELRDAFKENVDTHGEFLADEFFRTRGNAVVHAVIRQNDPGKMKKLFNLLNDMYENGENDVQSLIVVTILGEPLQDEKLLANCVDYMNDELCVNVIRVNKFLRSGSGKSARMRLENPPRYKPKKQRKNNLLSSLLGGGSGMGM